CWRIQSAKADFVLLLPRVHSPVTGRLTETWIARGARERH
ncbi:MAG: hypothetical protein AVDCRST_MAG68-5469, partial [uncultured Gemmatimonadetes bacterium]